MARPCPALNDASAPSSSALAVAQHRVEAGHMKAFLTSTTVRGGVFAGMAMLATGAVAVPVLQLGIGGGIYHAETETVVSDGPVFDLYAYLNRPSNTGTYYVSMALTGSGVESLQAPDFGSFTYDAGAGAVTVTTAGSMRFGTPPVDVAGATGTDAGDLASHGVFPAWFIEVPITFAVTDVSRLYDITTTADPAPVTPVAGDSTMFYRKIAIDVSGLTDGRQVHFDLYNLDFLCKALRGRATTACTADNLANAVDIDVAENAPFSHDAESGAAIAMARPAVFSSTVSEPGTSGLFGAGVVLVFLSRARRWRLPG